VFERPWFPAAITALPGAYYQRLLQDFFVHILHGVEPPDWNNTEQSKTATTNNH
jgi:hypothetical protein